MTTLTKTPEGVKNWAFEQAKMQIQSITQLVERLKCAEGCEGEESVREEIINNPLTVETHQTYEMMLCWGGPAVRIIGELDEHYQPQTAEMQYQDWGTPWMKYQLTPSEANRVIAYASEFYFGE